MEQAGLVIDAITSIIHLRICTPKLSIKKATSACALADIGRCSAPCELRVSTEQYAELVQVLTTAVAGESHLEDELRNRIAELSRQERFEEAALNRDRLQAWLSVTSRFHRLTAFTAIEQIAAAAPRADGIWEIHLIRYGKLCASASIDSSQSVMPMYELLIPTAEVVETPHSPAAAGSIAEAHLILKWLESPGMRILETSDAWKSPWPSQMRYREDVIEMAQAREMSATVVSVRNFSRHSAPK
jgi:DNA polymerase-3 subunit epsilon